MPNELTPRGAHCQPHRNLSRTSGAAHQQQSGQVTACDRKDERDDDEHQRGERHRHRVRLRVDPHVRRGKNRDACTHGALALAAKLIRGLGDEPPSQNIHRRLGLRERDAVAQTGFDEQGRDYRGGTAHAGDFSRRQSRNRQPEIRTDADVHGAAVIGGTDADDRHRHAVDLDDASEHGGVRAECSGPRLMSKDGDERSPGPFLRLIEPAAERRPQSQGVEVCRRRVFDHRGVDGAVEQIAGAHRNSGGRRRSEDVGVLGHLHVVRIRGDDKRPARAVVLIDVDEPIGIGERSFPKQHRVHEAEDRGVGADGEAEDQHRRRGETPIARQTANAVATVARERVECNHRRVTTTSDPSSTLPSAERP